MQLLQMFPAIFVQCNDFIFSKKNKGFVLIHYKQKK